MTRFASFRRATLLAAATLATLAAPLAQAGGPQARPFKATVITYETLAENTSDCPAQLGATVSQGTTTGQGNASHMGKVSLSATDCVIAEPLSFSFNKGELVLTAANGDKVTASYGGQLVPTTNPVVFTLYGGYIVKSGTGRFSKASGGGELRGSTNILTGVGVYEVSGLLSY